MINSRVIAAILASRRRPVVAPPAGSSNPFSLSFDGSNDIVALSSGPIPNAADFSFSWWANVPADAAANDAVFSQNGGSDRLLIYTVATLGTASNAVRVWSAVGAEIIVGNDIRGAGWTHLVITRSGNDWTLYENGSVAKTATSSATWAAANTARFGCGASASLVNENFFTGLLDEARIYNRALTLGEVGTLYGGGDVASGLTNHWKFDEGNGTTTADAVGSNTGTLASIPTWTVNTPFGGTGLVSAKFWRLHSIDGTNNGVGFRVGEWELFEAENAPAAASSGTDDLTNTAVAVTASHNAGNAGLGINNDGNATYWDAGGGSQFAYLQVELPTAKAVRSYTYQGVFGGSRPVTLSLEYSNDGSTWAQLHAFAWDVNKSSSTSRQRIDYVQ